LKKFTVCDSFKDFGTYSTTRIAIDSESNYFTTGHPTGIINIYKNNTSTKRIEKKVLK